MKIYKILLSVFLSIICVLTITGYSVQAEEETYPSSKVNNMYTKMVNLKGQDIDSFLSTLSVEDQELALTILKPKYIEVETVKPVSILTTYQSEVKTTVTLYNIYHVTLCKYIQRTIWDWNGTYITQPPMVSYAGYTYLIGWSYDGVLSHSESGGQGYTYFDAYSQGDFSLEVGGLVVDTWYPWIEHIVYGDGTYSVDSGDN